MITFAEIAERYLQQIGFEPYLCETEDEARSKVDELAKHKKWACLFTKSDTTGEKDFEEFFTDNETLDMERFQNLGVIKNSLNIEAEKIDLFEKTIGAMRKKGTWEKEEIVDLFNEIIPNFSHKDTGKYLDSKM